MTGKMPSPQVMQVLKSDVGRTLSIDIETGSTIALNDGADKKARLEFLNHRAAVPNIAPLVQSGQFPADVFKATISFALRSFKHGREVGGCAGERARRSSSLRNLAASCRAQQQAQGLQQQNQQLQGQLQQAQGPTRRRRCRRRRSRPRPTSSRPAQACKDAVGHAARP